MKKIQIIIIALLSIITMNAGATDLLNKDSTNQEKLLKWDFATSSEVNDIQNRTVACSGSYPIGNIYQTRTENTKILINGDPVITYGPWTESSRDCRTNILETKTVACPANQKGVHAQKRTYIQYYDGRIINNSGWSTTSNTCDYYYTTAGSETRSLGCPSGQTGTHTQKRTFQNYSDGSKRNYSAWVDTINNCAVTAPPVPAFVAPLQPANPPTCRTEHMQTMKCEVMLSNNKTYTFFNPSDKANDFGAPGQVGIYVGFTGVVIAGYFRQGLLMICPSTHSKINVFSKGQPIDTPYGKIPEAYVEYKCYKN